jgi:transcriptional regulator with XRE-family HTH domain
MAKPKFDINNLTDYRHKLGLNQSAFWSELGVTQSGGSRYESGQAEVPSVFRLPTYRHYAANSCSF